MQPGILHRRSVGRLLIAVALLGVGAVHGVAGKSRFNRQLSIGDTAPDWRDLRGTDDKRHSLADYKDAMLIVLVFTGNHCPMSKLYDERLLAFAGKFADRKVQWIAINVDGGDRDVLNRMKKRATEKKYPFPYIHDGSRAVARSYGATVTPHFFVLDTDRKVAYMGAFDDHFTTAKVSKTYLSDAVEALLAGKSPPIAETLQRGCEIPYEPSAADHDE